MIKIEGLKKSYQNVMVLDIEFLEIARNTCFGLVGNNGAGKTTLFRVMLDLVRASEGRVLLEGEDVSQTENWKPKVGAYLDEHMLLSYLTADEYFESLRVIYGLSRQDLSHYLETFRELFSDEILGKKKYIRDLSKGNVKKVGIAAAMIGDPQVVLLDEPFENLDPSSQNRLKRFILQEKQNKDITFLISSHDLAHVTDICDRIVLLEKGRIIKDLVEKEKMVLELNEYFEG